jgi:3-hydroxy-D-aspartate aldolase
MRSSSKPPKLPHWTNLPFADGRLGLGDKIRLIPGHCDPTVNLYDWYVCIRGSRVEQLWPITARGAVY